MGSTPSRTFFFCVFAFLRFCVFAFLRFCVFVFLRFCVFVFLDSWMRGGRGGERVPCGSGVSRESILSKV